MEQTKRWKRWSECLQTFPSNKYEFSSRLKRRGDLLVTIPLSKKDRKRIIDAAHAWAWNKKYTVRCTSYPADEEGMYTVYIHLIKKDRDRDYG